MLDAIAFDADDTLWHSETLYIGTQARFRALLEPYRPAEEVDRALHQTEMRNLEIFGYGVKGFTLSMIETAIELSEGRIAAADIQRIIGWAREMLDTPMELFPQLEETLAALAGTHRLLLVTKGDLLDQETKLARSGLGEYFDHVEIVSDKTPAAYRRILTRNGIEAGRFMMVGNSLRSDILPVVEIGGRAVYVPYEHTWMHENSVEANPEQPYHVLEHIGLLPDLVRRLEAGEG